MNTSAERKSRAIRYSSYVASIYMCASLLLAPTSFAGNEGEGPGVQVVESDTLYIGWASADITPDHPVLLRGQFHARISEGVMDPLTVTALAIESGRRRPSEKAILISCG